MPPNQYHMSHSRIDQLPHVGAKTLEVFAQAGLITLEDIYDRTCGQTLQEALQRMRELDPVFRDNEAYWKGLANRVQTVIARARSDEAWPYQPDYFVCPITWELMTEPVTSKYGDTYEREAIMRLIDESGEDIYHRPLTHADLCINRNLQKAIEYYREHELRFAAPAKLSQ